jgi:hypothetical protein
MKKKSPMEFLVESEQKSESIRSYLNDLRDKSEELKAKRGEKWYLKISGRISKAEDKVNALDAILHDIGILIDKPDDQFGK